MPPLILLGDPAIPLLHGLPLWASRDVLGPILVGRRLQRFGRRLTNPAAAGSLMALAMLGWHIPAAYEFALRSPGWHEVEHACFLVVFAFVLVARGSTVAQPSAVAAMDDAVYLLLADFVNSALSAFLTFSDRVFYPWYAACQARRNFRSERSGGRRSEHVGDRVVCFSDSGRDHHGEIALAPPAGREPNASSLCPKRISRALSFSA